MIPTNKLYIAAVVARSVLNRLRQRALKREPVSVQDAMDISDAIERLEVACFEHRQPEPDLSLWESALEELEVDL